MKFLGRTEHYIGVLEFEVRHLSMEKVVLYVSYDCSS